MTDKFCNKNTIKYLNVHKVFIIYFLLLKLDSHLSNTEISYLPLISVNT